VKHRQHLPQTIAFAVVTALATFTLGGCACWIFSQLGPVEQDVVSLVSAPWFGVASMPGLRRPSPSVGGANHRRDVAALAFLARSGSSVAASAKPLRRSTQDSHSPQGALLPGS
jgi:hypothetical protein